MSLKTAALSDFIASAPPGELSNVIAGTTILSIPHYYNYLLESTADLTSQQSKPSPATRI
jgi:hypothetical protein